MVDSGDPRLAAFLQAVDRMTGTPHLLIVCDGSPQGLQKCSPGGMSFFHAALQRSAAQQLSYHWMDCGRFWTCYDHKRGCAVRSVRHLYLSIEHLLSQSEVKEVFLMRPGSPFIGDELASIWMNRHPLQTRVFDVPSPIHTAADLVEEQISGCSGLMPRFHLSGPEFVTAPLSHLCALHGLIVVRSICDFYAASDLSPSLLHEVTRVVQQLGSGGMAVFLCHIGLQRHIVPCKDGELSDNLAQLSAVASPWTIVLVNRGEMTT
jgi:hypothetical protein